MSMRTIGGISPVVVNSLYPMEILTKYHQAHHIVGLTGRWMDMGGRALGGPFPGGPYHRLFFGHHILRDGYTAMVNPDLKFGEFLHHLGCDFLTKTGINNPILPVRRIAQQLIDQGFQQKFVNELLSINAPKVLGGSLSLICSGRDVFMAFSDAIPHTFSAAGIHFLYGSMNLAFGCFPPNLLLLTAGVAEIGVRNRK